MDERLEQLQGGRRLLGATREVYDGLLRHQMLYASGEAGTNVCVSGNNELFADAIVCAVPGSLLVIYLTERIVSGCSPTIRDRLILRLYAYSSRWSNSVGRTQRRSFSCLFFHWALI